MQHPEYKGYKDFSKKQINYNPCQQEMYFSIYFFLSSSDHYIGSNPNRKSCKGSC